MIAPRLSRGLCLLVGLGLLAGACSPKRAATKAPTSSSSAGAVSPTVTAPAAPPSSPPASRTPSPTPSPTPARTSKPLPGPTVSKPGPPAATAPAPSTPTPAVAAVSPPLLGAYLYNLSGTTQSPLLGLAQPYQPGATLTIDVDETSPQAGGTEVGFRGTTSQDQVQTATKQLYEGSRVVLTLTNLTFLGLASYDCSYVPPPEILPIPLQAVTLPTQSWSGAQCAGTLQLTVQGPETATAAGQPWSVWRIHSVVHYVAQSSIDVTLDTTSLFSPVLGMAVSSDATTSGKVAGSPFSSHQVTSLRSHP
jgi:hypothetical protein